MKLICEKTILIENINLVQKSVAGKSTNPIIECFLLTCDDNGFRMISTDLEIGIKTEYINCIVAEKGSIALPAKFFSDIIRKLPDGKVTIDVKDGLVVVIKCKQSEFKIVGKNADEFPELPIVEKQKGFKLSQSLFKTLIKRTSFSICTDDSKPNLMGALLEINANNFTMVTCDSARVSYAYCQYDALITKTEEHVIIPAKAVNEVHKLLIDDDSEFYIYFTEKHILFEFPNCIMVSRLIEGEFISYKNVFPLEFETTVTISKCEFENALERAVLISFQENKKIPLKLVMGDSTMSIVTGAETGNSYDELNIDIIGKELEISFNPKFLLDAVQAIDDGNIVMEFNSELSPCVLRQENNNEYKFLVLPLRLRN